MITTSTTRRNVLLGGLTGGLALSLGWNGAQASNSVPVKGGTLRVGIPGGGAAESLDPRLSGSNADIMRVHQLFEKLFELDENLKVVPVLAESAEPNKDGSVWIIRLRSGVAFHDGRPLTASDVIYTLNLWMEPGHPAYGTIGGSIEKAGVRAIDQLTVELPLKAPRARLAPSLTLFNQEILPESGFNAAHPVGTGPFVFESFTPGRQSVFKRNPNYWGEGGPYVDELVIISSFADPTSQVNALVGGQIDIAPIIPFAQARANLDGDRFNVLRAEGGGFHTFSMRTDVAPFNDVRVRQALKLTVERGAMVNTAFSGIGRPGNDLAGTGLQFFADDFVQQHDPDKAKALLAAAGMSDLKLDLHWAALDDGMTNSSRLFPQQAKASGITINLIREDPSQYFNTSTLYLSLPFFASEWSAPSSLAAWWSYNYLSTSPYNETHWKSERTDKLFAEAESQMDEGLAAEIWHDLQKEQFEDGGHIIWGFSDFVDGLSTKVHGLQPSKYRNCQGYKLKNAWIAG